MRIYLDVSCLDRPYDDQTQTRIRLEAEAVAAIIEKCRIGTWRHVSSQVVEIEVGHTPNEERRRTLRGLLPAPDDIMRLDEAIYRRGAELQSFGFRLFDALHVAAAEQCGAGVLLSCDDDLCRRAVRYKSRLRVRVANPLAWLKEYSDEANA